MEVNVEVQVNKKVKTTEDGSFLSGVVFFQSNISMSVATNAKCSTTGFVDVPISAEVFQNLLEEKGLTESTRVNLSRKGANPICNMRIDSLDAHDHHSPTFSSLGDMEDYIGRVMDRVAEVVELIDNEVPNWTPGEALPEDGYWAINPDQGGE